VVVVLLVLFERVLMRDAELRDHSYSSNRRRAVVAINNGVLGTVLAELFRKRVRTYA